MGRPCRDQGRQRGLGLLEALVALLVLGFGIVALARLQVQGRARVDAQRLQTTALHLAQDELEIVRSESAPVGRHAEVDPEAADATTYFIDRRVEPAALGGLRNVTVEVSWTDRLGPASPVRLSAMVATLPRAYRGALGLPHGPPPRSPQAAAEATMGDRPFAGPPAAPLMSDLPARPDPRTAASPMHEALALAHGAIGLSDPNPRVGCVIVGPDSQVIGRGHTQEAGGPHAEVMALRDVLAQGATARGATAYVTLEPCAHHGRTPPCCDALIEAGIARVSMALQDPFPLVAGRGAARLRAAGVQVDEGELAGEARELNIGFFSRIERGRPWVRLKAAVSIDGRTALGNGQSQWITGPVARTDGHAWRKRASALLTGVGTVLDDDPRLDVRLVETARQPMRVIVDSRLETPAGARILAPPGQVLVYAANGSSEKIASLEQAGAEIAWAAGPHGKVDLPNMLADLARRGVNELHLEAGHKLNGSFVREGLVDEYLIYMAPRLLGQGLGLATFGPLERLPDAPSLRFTDIARFGDDLRLLARPATID